MWRHLAASVSGTSHLASGTPCQDYSYAAELSDANLLVLVCSDGAGSAAYSHIGSQVACLTLVDELTTFTKNGGSIDNVDHATASEWIQRIRSKLQTQAEALGVEIREVACTLVAAIIGERESAFLQIGDGAVVSVGDDDTYKVVFWPDQGEYINTTFFLTAPDALEKLRFERNADPLSDVALFTDGLQSVALKYDLRQPHAPFFSPMFARLRADEDWPALVEPLEAFLQSESMNKRTDDDRTLILASRV